MDLGRNDLSRGGTTVATSSSSVVNAKWGSSTPLPDFPMSGNHFPISVILLISGYPEIIFWYREIISGYRKMRFISRYRQLFSWYREIEFPISENNSIFPDIRNLISRYREIISRYRELFPDIGNYRKIISDIGKWWLKTQMAFHSKAHWHILFILQNIERRDLIAIYFGPP